MNATTTPFADRVYLNVPFAEKDAAKRHGARWDPDRVLWWIARSDLARYPGIANWLPAGSLRNKVEEAGSFIERFGYELSAAPKLTAGAPAATSSDRGAACLQGRNERRTESRGELLPSCDCASPPWEHCEHTASGSAGYGA